MDRYTKRYNKLIQHYKNNPTEGYCERHHIIPLCMNGEDSLENIVLLPAKAHFIAHYLLYKMYPDNHGLAKAFSMMSVNNKFQNRKITGKLYELSKIARSNSMKGVPRPEWVKKKLRVPKKSNKNYIGRKLTEETKAKLSKAHKGKKFSDSHKKNLRASMEKVYKNRTEKRNKRARMFQILFEQFDGTKKEFAKRQNINYNTMKGYLRETI